MSTHIPRRRFGQNFLVDQNIVNKIITAIRPQTDDFLIEIGPGQAAITQPLLDSGANLHVIEIDRDLSAALKTLATNQPNLTVHVADALKFDFSALATQQKLRVVGNLPYNISTPLLFHLFDSSSHIVDMHFMLQREVVQRMAAEPGSKIYGRLSVMTQYFCAVEPLFSVQPGSFQPAPKVVSEIVRLTPHQRPPVALTNFADFERLVRCAFNQRRKTIRNGLKPLLPAEAIQAAGIDPNLRAETINLEGFSLLANQLSQHR